MRQRLVQLSQSAGLRQSLVMIVGNIGATSLSAVALILISRFLGPNQFGWFSVGFAVVVIMSRFNEAGLNSTLLKFIGGTEDRAEVRNVFNYTLKIKLLLSLGLVSIGVLITPWLSQVLHLPGPGLLWAAFIFSVATTWYEQVVTTLQAVHRFAQAVSCNALQAGTKLIGAVVLPLVGLTQVGPIFGWYMLGPLVPVLLLHHLLPSWLRLRWTDIWSAKSRPAWIVLAKHAAVGSIAAGLIENVDVLFVQGYLSSYETGLLSGVSRIAVMITLVGYSLGTVLNPRVARYKDRQHLKPYLSKATLLALAAVVGFVAFLPFAQLSIWLTVGPEYMAGTPVLIILVAAAFLTICTIPFLALFYSFKADWYFSVSGLMQLAIVLVGNWLLVPSYGLAGAAWTRFASRLCLFVFTVITSLWLYSRQQKDVS